MPRKAKSKEGYRHDLEGTWYQCLGPVPHLTENPIFLGDVGYCHMEDCNAAVKLVHSCHDDKENVEQRRRVWNSMNDPKGKKVTDEP